MLNFEYPPSIENLNASVPRLDSAQIQAAKSLNFALKACNEELPNKEISKQNLCPTNQC